MFDSPREACGVFGVYAPGEDVSRLTFFGIYALQHRGQESAGIATADGQRIRLHTNMGLVSQVFEERDLERLTGHAAIGHTRYSTTGSSKAANAQPLMARGPDGELALAHNGNVVNALELRAELQQQGVEFVTTTDSEVIAWLIATAPGKNWQERLHFAMTRLRGAYSLTILTKDSLIAVRDPLGVRPLSLGRLNGGWVVASETCALDHLGAALESDVQPGEAIIINADGITRFQAVESERRASCVFEQIYFSRPDSRMNGRLVYQAREAMGAQLAIEHPVEADLVTGVPDSATAAGLGYARKSGIPYTEVLLKNRYVGRTFIQPDQRLRDLGVRLKFNPLTEVLKGKRVIVVDDSIVRGTTTPHVVSLLRRAGATEVHLRICAPPIQWPCHFGVDMATRGELIAAQKSVEEIRKFVGADTLGYLSTGGLAKAVVNGHANAGDYCMACFTGKYPIPVQLELDKFALEMV
ncbi:MAG: amidophosphoribosyltransferase [Chloroflexi bacterium]|nr:amidophosphoribosyltransferase [Chloroflexota bacterium]